MSHTMAQKLKFLQRLRDKGTISGVVHEGLVNEELNSHDDTHEEVQGRTRAEVIRMKANQEDELTTFVKNYSNQARKEPDRNIMEHYPTLSTKQSVLLDWPDRHLTNLGTVYLKHLNHQELRQLGSEVFNGIHTRCTQQTVAGIMLLAYNLMDKNGDHIMDQAPEWLIDLSSIVAYEDVPPAQAVYGSMREMSARTGRTEEETDEDVDMRIACGYCYLAASYLRLFTKSAANYMKIGDHLKNKFQNFYLFQFPFEEFHPDSMVVEHIKKQFEMDEMFKKTLYVILYCAASNPDGDNVKDFLFRIHLTYTGLHPFVLFVRVMELIGLDSSQIANLIYIPAFSAQIAALGAIIKMEVDEDQTHKLKMWKYGRLFNKDFLSTLQTKNCQFFTMVLVYFLGLINKTAGEGALNIAQLKGVGDDERKIALAIARRSFVMAQQIRMGVEHADARFAANMRSDETRLS